MISKKMYSNRFLGAWILSWMLLSFTGLTGVSHAQQSGGGNYPTGNGVRVKEVDGSPNVPGTQTLVFPNGSLTRAGQTVTVTIASGTTINSTNGQVPYRVNATTFGNSAFASNALNSTYLSATSGASGAGVVLTVAGGGTDEGLVLTPKGGGNVSVGTSANTATFQVLSNVSGKAAAEFRAFSGDVGATALVNYVRGDGSTLATITAGGGGTFAAAIAVAAGGANLIGYNGSQFGWTSLGAASYSSTLDTAWARAGAAIIRGTNGSTGAGKLLLGTSSDSATGCQLCVFTASATESGLKLRALTGTLASQSVLNSTNASGTVTFDVNAGGSITIPTTTTATSGVIYKGSTAFIHNFNPAGGDGGNVFVGGSGNFTMAVVGPSYEASRNTVVGENSGTALTTGYFNNILGYESCRVCTTAAGTSILGSRAAYSLTTGHDNAAIGDNALYSNTTGEFNQAVGYQSLYQMITGNGNAALGRQAGYGLLDGNYNTFIGYAATVTTTTSGLSNSTALGANATVTKSNQMVLGASDVTETLLYGKTIVAGQIDANNPGGNIRMKGNGTSGNDGFLGMTSGGVLYLSNWSITRGWVVKADGTISSIGGDVAASASSSYGFILRSPDNTCYRFTVANGGTLNAGASVTCP